MDFLRVAVIDDDELMLRAVVRCLRGHRPSWDVVSFNSVEAARSAWSDFDVLIGDLQMRSGARFLREVADRNPWVYRIAHAMGPGGAQLGVPMPAGIAHHVVESPSCSGLLQLIEQWQDHTRDVRPDSVVSPRVGSDLDLDADRDDDATSNSA